MKGSWLLFSTVVVVTLVDSSIDRFKPYGIRMCGSTCLQMGDCSCGRFLSLQLACKICSEEDRDICESGMDTKIPERYKGVCSKGNVSIITQRGRRLCIPHTVRQERTSPPKTTAVTTTAPIVHPEQAIGSRLGVRDCSQSSMPTYQNWHFDPSTVHRDCSITADGMLTNSAKSGYFHTRQLNNIVGAIWSMDIPRKQSNFYFKLSLFIRLNPKSSTRFLYANVNVGFCDTWTVDVAYVLNNNLDCWGFTLAVEYTNQDKSLRLSPFGTGNDNQTPCKWESRDQKPWRLAIGVYPKRNKISLVNLDERLYKQINVTFHDGMSFAVGLLGGAENLIFVGPENTKLSDKRIPDDIMCD